MKVLVANRGEIAVRVLRACRELGLPSVAVFSEADAGALHVRLADESVCIGPPAAARSYLDAGAIVAAARATGAEAVHPGYGFLAENPAFAQACADAGLRFVGPSAETIRAMGDKAEARARAAACGVATVPGSDGVVPVDAVAAVAERLGFPLMIKAAAGGGGRGIRVVESADELEGVVLDATREADVAFGSGEIYLERLLVEPRHIEVQVFGDTHGTVVHLYERECSIQRRRQKLVEEALSPSLDGTARAALTAAAVRLAREIGYVGAGTVEFLVADDGSAYFIEMNTRIQVEHPVTELVTGVDLVKEQLRVALGERLSFAQDDVVATGAAIELRINAENPELGFFPSPGAVTELHLPGGPGVRVDTALFAGCTVPPFYDSLVAKVVVWGRDRDEAIVRGRRALDELEIGGIATTTGFHRALLDDPRFVAGRYDTGYLEKLL
ncbi:MAG: acetyl-CoA carboxylase biotin carboxylase subunit [Gaiellales bacterium]